MTARLKRAIRERVTQKIGESGQGLAEYALILAFVALVCAAALSALGASIAGSPGFTIP